MGNNDRHILGLDLIRFAAAAMVMVFHYDIRTGRIFKSWTGWVGVEVFFVLSGFVICYSADGSTAAAFARSRLVRLMPAIWLCGTATALAFIIIAGDRAAGLAWRYLNTLVLWPIGPWIDGSYWTLPIEVAFYALVWLTLLHRRAPRLETVLTALALISAAYWTVRVGQQFFPQSRALGAIVSLFSDDAGARLLMFGFGCYFALGGLMYVVLQDGLTARRVVCIVLALLAGAAQIVFSASFWVPAGGHKTLPVAIWMAFSAAILLSAWGNRAIFRVLGSYAAPIRLLGLSTYPLYLLHDDIGNLLISQLGAPVGVVMVAMVVIALAFSATIEPKAQAWLRRALWVPQPRQAVVG